jgi:disulfide bond formation protein DsbB
MRQIAPNQLPTLIVLASAMVLVAVTVFEHGFGYEPCQLCLYQRIPWWSALGLGSIAMILMKARPTLALMVVITALVAIAIGGGIAAYHAGVEYKFWEGPAGCTGARNLVAGLSDALGKVDSGPVPPACDEVPWSLFGISMAGCNFLFSLGLIAVCYGIARRARKALI